MKCADKMVLIVKDAVDLRDVDRWAEHCAFTRSVVSVELEFSSAMQSGSRCFNVYWRDGSSFFEGLVFSGENMCSPCMSRAISGLLKHLDCYAWKSFTGCPTPFMLTVVEQSEHVTAGNDVRFSMEHVGNQLRFMRRKDADGHALHAFRSNDGASAIALQSLKPSTVTWTVSSDSKAWGRGETFQTGDYSRQANETLAEFHRLTARMTKGGDA